MGSGGGRVGEESERWETEGVRMMGGSGVGLSERGKQWESERSGYWGGCELLGTVREWQ